MNNLLKSHLRLWLILGLAAAALLTLAFQGGQDDTDPAHCHSCKTPTPTHTPTTLPPQACQIAEVLFNDQPYSPGQPPFETMVGTPIKVTLRISDSLGAPLIGANVDATVTQTNTVEAAAIPPLEDQSGTYDAVYTPQNPGTYVLKFMASDFTGPRFLPCSAERIVIVNDPDNLRQCRITHIEFDHEPPQYTIGQSIQLTTTLVLTNGFTPSVTATINDTDSITLNGSGTTFSGIYTNTNQAQAYNFMVTARDSDNNQNVCTAQRTAFVGSSSSTSTLFIKLPAQPIELCGRRDPDITSTVAVSNVTNLSQVDLSVAYNPTFIIPSEITPIFGSGTVTPGNPIRYQGSSNAPVSGAIVDLLNIDWRLQGRRGTTTITLTSTLRDNTGAPIPHTAQNGSLTITISPPCLRCTVNLQGRADHSGVMVTSPAGEQAQSYPNGLFAIAATGELNLTAPGYLSTQMAASVGLTAGEPEIDACQVTLLAGDANGDNTVNILDLTYLAGRYQSADPTADLNASGLVDILDLALAAGNYQRQGQ